jgi:nucleoside-diphosphate-sugar epimerase
MTELMTTLFLTGGTGFVGSHVAEEARKRGWTVRALARANSDTNFLKSLGTEIVEGELTDAAVLRTALQGVDFVIHSAAKVGDWGPVEDYRQVNVEGLRALLEAAKGIPLKRFVHVSSLGVYEARHHYGTDESEPLPEFHIDGYTQSKVEAEKLALDYHRKHDVPVAVVRPGFIYGPRDRSVLPRMIERLRNRSVKYIARGKYALNTTYVGNLVHAIFLALEHPAAVGEVFNITDGEFVSKRRFIEAVADGLGLPRPTRSIPLWLAKPLAKWREGAFRRRNKPNPPIITQAIVKFAGLNLDFSIGKARTVLGYTPPTSFSEGMSRAVEWFRTEPR